MKLADLNLKDETLNRTIKETRGRELPWYACFLLLFILPWVPYFKYDRVWLLLLPVLVIPLIYLQSKMLNQQTKLIFDNLPAESQEEFRRHGVYIDQMKKRYAMIMIPAAIVWCVILILWGQHRMEKIEREAEEKLAIRIQQMRNAPARK